MKKTRAYEVADMRQPNDGILGVVGIIEHIPGGLEIRTNVKGIVIDLRKEENDELVEIEKEGERVTFHFEKGDVVMTGLTLDNYIKRVAPFVEWVPEDFSAEGLNDFFYGKVRDL